MNSKIARTGSSTADLPRGTAALPTPVADAFHAFAESCKTHGVPMGGFEAAIENALRYKELFHSMQDKLNEAQDEIVRRGYTIREQRRIIGRLEQQLGIDDDL